MVCAFVPSGSAGLTQFVCLSACLSIGLPVCLFVSVCASLSVKSSFSLANDHIDREHVIHEVLDFPTAIVVSEDMLK